MLSTYRPLTGRHKNCDQGFHVYPQGYVEGVGVGLVPQGWWMGKEEGEDIMTECVACVAVFVFMCGFIVCGWSRCCGVSVIVQWFVPATAAPATAAATAATTATASCIEPRFQHRTVVPSICSSRLRLACVAPSIVLTLCVCLCVCVCVGWLWLLYRRARQCHLASGNPCDPAPHHPPPRLAPPPRTAATATVVVVVEVWTSRRRSRWATARSRRWFQGAAASTPRCSPTAG